MANQPLIVEFWDVGQGDCSVLRVQKSRVILIDVGPRNSPIVDWLILNPKIFVESIVLTHNHADHAGALAGVLDAARFRIGTVYFLDDRTKRDAQFVSVFSCLDAALRSNQIGGILRLEAPQKIWSDSSCSLEVRFPNVSANIQAGSPNKTAGILTLNVNGKDEVIWASDSLLESVHLTCGACSPHYLVGPHHGAPEDRGHAEAQNWISEIGPQVTYLSVGKNKYGHPQPSYIRKNRIANASVVCSQLTSLCDRTRKTDVVKSHARLGIPQPNSGVACRGPVRLTLRGRTFVGDNLDNEHKEEIAKLERPKCIRWGN